MDKLKTIVLNKLIQYYKILKKITINRGKNFIFHYKKILILLLKMRPRLLTIYQPKIDKKTKRANFNLK